MSLWIAKLAFLTRPVAAAVLGPWICHGSVTRGREAPRARDRRRYNRVDALSDHLLTDIGLPCRSGEGAPSFPVLRVGH